MKRDPFKKYITKKIYPLFFWKYCIKCKKEFRREWGWYFMSYVNCKNYQYRYICSECFSTHNEAEDWAINYCRPPHLSTKPPINKPPPKGK